VVGGQRFLAAMRPALVARLWRRQLALGFFKNERHVLSKKFKRIVRSIQSSKLGRRPSGLVWPARRAAEFLGRKNACPPFPAKKNYAMPRENQSKRDFLLSSRKKLSNKKKIKKTRYMSFLCFFLSCFWKLRAPCLTE
jgi:hypothetical protein